MGGGRRTAAILLLALALRIAGAIPDFYHFYDEVWQYLEPAYGLVHDRWTVTWEYRAGIRGWLLPSLFAAPFILAKAAGADAHAAILAIRIALAVLATGIVAAGMAIGARISRLHALAAGLVLATSFELVFFAARPLSESIAGSLILPAAAALTARRDRRTARAVLAAGVLLGLAASLRFQLAPMLAALALAGLGRDRVAWRWLLLGGLAGLVPDALASLAQGQAPFAWIVANVRLNLIAGISERYGISPPWWYATALARQWGAFSLPLAVLVAIGTRRAPALTIAALVNVAFHSLIAHKELRFVFPGIPLLLTVAALGAGDVAARLRARPVAVTALALLFAGASIFGLASAGREGRVLGSAQIAAWRAAHAGPATCGYATLGDRATPQSSRAFVDRPVPAYLFAGPGRVAAMRSQAHAFDVIFAAEAHAGALAPLGYALRGCGGAPGDPADFCVYRRAGGCAAGDPRYLENAVLARAGR